MDTAKMDFSIIVAGHLTNRGIGKNGKIPWRIKKDTEYFKIVTTNVKDKNKKNAVIMGSKTYLSIPPKFRPLPDRLNIVITRNPQLREKLSIPLSVVVVSSFEEALKVVDPNQIETVFVGGGGQIYSEAIKHKSCKRIYYTDIISPKFECDVFFPIIDSSIYLLSRWGGRQEEGGCVFEFMIYAKK